MEDLQRELMHLNQEKQVVEVEYSTLKKSVLSKEEEVKRRQSMMEVSEIIIMIQMIISQSFVIKLLSSADFQLTMTNTVNCICCKTIYFNST